MPAQLYLYRCSSCERRSRRPSDGAPALCAYCGGPLNPVWGLGQLASPGGGASPRQDLEARVRDRLDPGPRHQVLKGPPKGTPRLAGDDGRGGDAAP